jgi:hypothetical protein
MDFGFVKLPKGIQMRKPYAGELDYFKNNPSVAGMATEDNKVILNPYSRLTPANTNQSLIMKPLGFLCELTQHLSQSLI